MLRSFLPPATGGRTFDLLAGGSFEYQR